MRLIDADALVSALNNGRLKEQTGRAVPFNAGVAFALTMVEYAPTIDAVPREDYEELERHFVNWEPVVRCKDCRHWSEMQNLTGACLRRGVIDGSWWTGTDSTDYCSFAERRNDE